MLNSGGVLQLPERYAGRVRSLLDELPTIIDVRNVAVDPESARQHLRRLQPNRIAIVRIVVADHRAVLIGRAAREIERRAIAAARHGERVVVAS